MPRRENVDEWFWQVGSELHRLNEELIHVRPAVASGKCWEPRVDVLEDKSRILIKAEIAGARGEDIQILYLPERHTVLIRGLRREEDGGDEDRTGFYQLEIYYGEFQREVRLPDIAIRPDQIRAQYRNGFLLVMIPKQEQTVIERTVRITKT